MSKELKIIKVTCSKCGHLDLIPGFESVTVDNPIKCEKCGKVLVVRESGTSGTDKNPSC